MSPPGATPSRCASTSGVAAAIHGLEVGELDWLDGFRTPREHGEALTEGLADLEDAADPEVREALAWLRENRPADEPACLVHGDLLGQNLLVWPEEPPRVLDWELAMRGDPAMDLAIVTRGVRPPFQTEGGMRRLIEAHGRFAGRELREEEVRFHEICMHLAWYRLGARGEADAEPVGGVLARLRNLLHWVGT